MTKTTEASIFEREAEGITAYIRNDPAAVKELSDRELKAVMGWTYAIDTDVNKTLRGEFMRRTPTARWTEIRLNDDATLTGWLFETEEGTS